jgi:hypothetical protein
VLDLAYKYLAQEHLAIAAVLCISMTCKKTVAFLKLILQLNKPGPIDMSVLLNVVPKIGCYGVVAN